MTGPNTRAKVKVAVLIPTLEVGGAEQDIVRNFPQLDRDQFEVVVVCFDYAGPLAPVLEHQGVRVVARNPDPGDVGAAESAAELGAFGRLVRATPEGIKRPARAGVKRFFRLRPVAWTLRKAGASRYMLGVTRWVGQTLQTEQVDIVHCFLPHSYVYGMFACRFWRPQAKTAMSRLSLNFYKNDQKLIAWLETQVLHRRVDVAIGNSLRILDELAEEGVPRERLRLLYNGIDLAPFLRGNGCRQNAREALSLSPSAFVMVAVGNLWRHKGHGTLIEACALVRDGLPEGWQLLIAGRDEEGNAAAYEARIVELGLEEHIRLLGSCHDVPQLLAAADLFVQPSLHEGLPNAVIEAMASSLPVVASAVGGIPEVVQTVGESKTGSLVPPADPVALSRALIEIADDNEALRLMGELGRARAEAEFSLERSVRDYQEIYRELLGRSGDSSMMFHEQG